MKVADRMTRNVHLAAPDETIAQAARAMAVCDTGALPVGSGGHIVGMVTDRDIALRAVALGKGPDTLVREVMSAGVTCCFEDEELDQVARRMAEQQVRRMPVMTRDHRLVGILSLGDLATGGEAKSAGEALRGISRPCEAGRRTATRGGGRGG
jgi:CBS domain-containing protein